MSFPFTTTLTARGLARATGVLVNTSAAVAFLGLVASVTWAAQPAAPPLYRIADGAALQIPSDSATVEARAIEVETEQLAMGAEELYLPLFDGVPHKATRTKFESRAPDDVTWRGTLDGAANRRLADLKVVSSGLIYSPDALYEIGPTADGGQRLAYIDGRGSLCGGAIEPPAEYARPLNQQVVLSVSRDRIDVMVVYTPEAQSAAGNGWHRGHD
jgi:hypothetical protein